MHAGVIPWWGSSDKASYELWISFPAAHPIWAMRQSLDQQRTLQLTLHNVPLALGCAPSPVPTMITLSPFFMTQLCLISQKWNNHHKVSPDKLWCLAVKECHKVPEPQMHEVRLSVNKLVCLLFCAGLLTWSSFESEKTKDSITSEPLWVCVLRWMS